MTSKYGSAGRLLDQSAETQPSALTSQQILSPSKYCFSSQRFTAGLKHERGAHGHSHPENRNEEVARSYTNEIIKSGTCESTKLQYKAPLMHLIAHLEYPNRQIRSTICPSQTSPRPPNLESPGPRYAERRRLSLLSHRNCQ